MNPEQIQRIGRLEATCDRGTEALAQLVRAAGEYQQLLPELQELEAYYLSPQWLEDRDADQAGQLPKDLKRGILAEDTIYDLLTDISAMKALLRELTREE